VYVSWEPGVALQGSMEWDDDKCLNLIEIYKNKELIAFLDIGNRYCKHVK
jgi:hypothetical protein